MRHVVAAVTAMLLSTSLVHADESLPHTRAVLERHAKASRRNRTVGAVLLASGGIAAGIGGFAVVRNADGWFADLEKAVGYTLMGIGGLAVVNSVILVATDSPFERLRDEVTTEQDARFARTEVSHKARTMRRTRRLVGGIGLALAGSGAIAATAGALSDRNSETGEELLGSGIAIGALGVGLALGSAFESRWETIDREMGASPPTALMPALAPIRGGLLAGVGGVF